MTKNQVLLRFITRHGLPLSTMSILEYTITLSKYLSNHFIKNILFFLRNLYAKSVQPCQAYVHSAMINNQKLKTKVSMITTTSKFIPKCNGKQSREVAVRYWHIYL